MSHGIPRLMRHPTHLVVLSVQMQASYMGKIRFKASHHLNYSINCELKYINLTSAFYQVDGVSFNSDYNTSDPWIRV